MIEASAANLRAAVDHVVAVVRPDPVLIQVLTDCGCEIVVNERTDEGIGGSIAAGVRAASGAQGWLIALGDMPYIQPETIALVRAALDLLDEIIVPVYLGRSGHPVAFPESVAAELTFLNGDVGAKAVVNGHLCHPVHVDDPGVLQDVDFPRDMR